MPGPPYPSHFAQRFSARNRSLSQRLSPAALGVSDVVPKSRMTVRGLTPLTEVQVRSIWNVLEKPVPLAVLCLDSALFLVAQIDAPFFKSDSRACRDSPSPARIS